MEPVCDLKIDLNPAGNFIHRVDRPVHTIVRHAYRGFASLFTVRKHTYNQVSIIVRVYKCGLGFTGWIAQAAAAVLVACLLVKLRDFELQLEALRDNLGAMCMAAVLWGRCTTKNKIDN